MKPEVLCDRCGQPLGSVGAAVLTVKSDGLGRATALQLDHVRCAEARRDGLRDEEVITTVPAAALRADRLRRTARAHWASASRILAKVKRLQSAGVPW